MEETVKMTKIIQDITSIVRLYFSKEFDTESVYYYRFITHLKFFAQRIVSNTPFEGNEDDSLLDIIIKKYNKSYQCTEKIAEMIQKSYNFTLSDEEKMYLTIHVPRIMNASTK